MGHFRIGVRAPGDNEGAHFLMTEEQGILDNEACLEVSRMGKLIGTANVSGGVDSVVAGLEIVVDRHSPALARLVGDLGGFQIKTLDVGSPAGADDNLIHFQRTKATVAVIFDDLAGVGLSDLQWLIIEDQCNPFPLKHLLDNGGGVSILLIHNPIVFMEERDPGAQPLKGLGKFATEGTGSHDR